MELASFLPLGFEVDFLMGLSDWRRELEGLADGERALGQGVGSRLLGRSKTSCRL